MSNKIMIGVQARSGSTRLPRKAYELIGGKPMLRRVLTACERAAAHMERRDDTVDIILLTPEGDPIAKDFGEDARVVEGPLADVLSRYVIAAEKFGPDFIVRITGDCPLIPPYVIDGVVKLATRHELDYISNADDRFRTSMDGIDVEVMSSRMLMWLAVNAETAYDREHVTPLARRAPPPWARIGAVVHYFDQSDCKLSVDTHEDLQRVRAAFNGAFDKYQDAIRALGLDRVFRF